MMAEDRIAGTVARRSAGKTAARTGKSRRGAAKPTRGAMGRKTAPVRAARNITKAAYVREQPLTMSAREVVVSAARLGLVMTPDYVHKVRSTTKSRNADRSPAMPIRQGVGKEAPVRGTSEAGFRRLVLQLGLVRSRALLADVERRLNELVSM